jgi:putative nucleotidyltransferase with HDIG domain
LNKVSGQLALANEAAPERPSSLKKTAPAYALSNLLIPTSSAIDLAEGREPGHAQRVAYIAGALAEALDLDQPKRLASVYAGLLHDAGVIAAGAGLGAYTRGDERLVFSTLPLLTPEEAAAGASESTDIVAERIIDHTIHGARTAKELGLPQEAVQAIATHHERWDGSGYPHGLSGEQIPIIGRIAGLADYIEAQIEDTMPLLARRNFGHCLARIAGHEADPKLTDTLAELANADTFWLGLFGADLPGTLAAGCHRLRESRNVQLEPFIERFARLVDSRFSFMDGVSGEVARVAEALGRAAGLRDPRLRRLRIAAYLHDVGQLAVSERILAKPGILSVEELETLHHHPMYSRDVIAGIGFEEESGWVAAHHEWVDGRGYPEETKADDIPLEARILAIADAYVAMVSDRPHRPAMLPKEAKRVLKAGAGSQFDAELVDVFIGEDVA